MSPTKRPSAVSGLQRGLGATQAEPAMPEIRNAVADLPPRPEKPVRVTLNIPPALYRDIERWATAEAETFGMPRVSIQDAMRAMLRACVTDTKASSAASDLVHRDNGQSPDGRLPAPEA